MKISLGAWAFSFGPYAEHPIPFETVARRCSETGYAGIEVCGFPPHVTLESFPTTASRKEAAGLLSDLGLGISGYSADLSEVNPVSPDNHEDYLQLFRRNVDLCADLGSPMIRVDSGAAPGSIPEQEYESAFHRISAIWGECAEIARISNVRLAWEFEPGFAFNKPGEVVRMHQEVRHPNFFVLFDTAHAYMSAVVGARQRAPKDILIGGVEELLDKLQGRIGAIHIIDSDGTLYHEETSTHRPFGQGRIDFKHLAPRLLRLPNIDWWTIDLCFWPGAWEMVEPSRRFVADLLAHHAQTG
jgi:sugar phosphate isomerase/epimerase